MSTYIKRGVSDAFAEYVLDEFTPARLLAAIENPSEMVWVCEIDEGLAGYLRLSQGKPCPEEGGGDTEILTLYVQPRHQKTGIGARLIKAAAAQTKGPIWLKVNEENAPAIAFYTAYGFEQIGRIDFRIGDAAYPNHVMVLRSSR